MSENKGFIKGKDTKKKIVEACMELFATHGYKGASMRKIAAKVGIRESAIYNHFTNKEAILAEVAKEVFSTPFSNRGEKKLIEEYAKKGKPFLAKFTTEFKLLSFDKRSERLFRFMIIEIMQQDLLRDEFQKRFHDENIEYISTGLFSMMQSGLIRSSDPIVMAQEFLAPLFYLRVQVSLLRASGKPTSTYSSSQFEKHLDFFWESIKRN